MSNPLIPQHSAARGDCGPRLVRFVKSGSSVRLQDEDGNSYPLELVHMATGAFGFNAEGLEKEPRCWVLTTTGAVTIEGDWYVLDFLRDSRTRPILLSAVRRLTASRLFQKAAGQDLATLTMKAYDSASGVETGSVEVTAHEEPGVLDITASERLTLNGGGAAVAREGDSVAVQFTPAVILNLTASLLSTGAFTPGLAAVPPTVLMPDVTGGITSGSETVEAG